MHQRKITLLPRVVCLAGGVLVVLSAGIFTHTAFSQTEASQKDFRACINRNCPGGVPPTCFKEVKVNQGMTIQKQWVHSPACEKARECTMECQSLLR